MLTQTEKDYLDNIFYKDGAFTLGLNKFNDIVNHSDRYIPQEKIRYYYSNQEITQLFKPRKRMKNINISESNRPFNKLYADSLFLTSANIAILNILDYYSRFNYLFAFKLSQQINSTRSSNCLMSVINDANKRGYKIHKIITDQGSEFLGKFNDICSDNNIIHEYSRTGDKTKTAPIESFNRTVRLMYERFRLIYHVDATNIFKIMNMINDIYNNSYHSSIKAKPIDIINNDVVKEIKPKTTIDKLAIGDNVRIYIKDNLDPFTKLSPLWSRKIYKIKSRNNTTGNYKLDGLTKYYKIDELQKINTDDLMIYIPK